MAGGAVRLAACAVAAVAAAFAFASSAWSAPIGISALDAPYQQSFDTLAATGSSSTLPDGWAISETGTSAKADGQYTAGTGSSTTGDTYSFGAAASADRALGSLLSGTISESYGAAFTNQTSQTVTSLDIAYTGEEWRLGQTGRGADRLDFQVSTDATSLTTGTWTDVDALDFSSPNVTDTVGALDGNAAGNRTAVSGNAGGLAVAPGQTVWIRWVDFNATGSDDGLAVDDLTVTPRGSGSTSSAPVVASCGGAVTTTQGTPASATVTASDADGRVDDIHIAAVSPAASGISVSAFTPALTAGGTATATIGVDASTPAGTYAVTVVAANDDPTPQSGQCTLAVNVQAAATVLPIGTVQGTVSDTADGATFASPYAGKQVTVQGVVTELTFDGGYHGFYLQNTAAEADADPNSSDGIFVFTSTFTDLKNGYVPVVGDDIRLTGTVSEYYDQTEIGSASATRVGTGTVTPFVADPPSDSADAARYWERREGMQATVPAGSVVDSPRHFYASSDDTEFYAIAPDAPVAQRTDPYARRAFRDAHPLDDEPGTFDNGNGYRILITDEGIKATAPNAQLPPVHTFQTIAAPVTGGVYYDFGSYSVSVATQPTVADGADPSQNDPPQAFDRSQAYSIANFNMDNLYDYRDDPFDGCDFTGNPGCPGVSPPFDYPPASDAEYQQRETEIAHQIVDDLHAPDVIVVAEAEDQDICSVQGWTMVCGTTNNADGKPDVLQELAIHIHQLGGPDYDAANDRDGADARGIVSGFLYRTDRVGLIPASATDPVLGSSPAVQYRGAPLAYDTDVQNPKALNAVLPSDVDLSTGNDGSNVFTRAAQVAHFRISPTTAPGAASDIWVIANHFTSTPEDDIGQRREQAAYNAALVKAIQSGDPQAKVMVAGDLNDYPRPDDPIPPSAGGPSDQLAPLYDAGLDDLYDTVLANHPSSAYSYVYQGQAQDLDHQFVTPSFFGDLQAVNEAHVNSDWPLDVPGDDRGTSDHDPMVSRWALQLDHAPSDVSAGGPYTVDEGGTTTLHAAANDADSDPLTYSWDLDGDGVYETTGQDAAFHAGDGPATQTVSVKATDPSGLSSTATTTVTVANVAPTATFTATGTVTAGGTVALSLEDPSDPSAADTAAGFEYAFDCGDGSGYGVFSATSTATCPAASRGTLGVGGEIRDKDGGVREYRGTVTVNGRSPVVSAGGPYAVDEGGAVSLTATGSDPDGDSISYAWDLDGNGTFETSGQTVTYHAGDGPATPTVTVQATDSTGATSTSSATVTIRNVAPTATLHAPATATVGVPFAVSLTNASDPSAADTAGFQYAFDCGDGTGYGPFGSASSASCRAFLPGTVTVRASIRDRDGGTTERTATVAVGVTFDGVCAVVKQFTSNAKLQKTLCDLLAKAQADEAKGHQAQKADDLAKAGAAVLAGVADGSLSRQEGIDLAKLLAKL